MINEDEELALAYLFDPAFEFTNTAGKPLTGGYIELYVHGTRNKYYAYSDWNGHLHPFQIPLDGLGANIVLVSPQFTYDAYIYSKYGTLQMSRYNVSPVGVGEVSVSGINVITSSDGTVEVSQYGDTFDLSVPDITAVSGLVEDVAELTTAVTGIEEDVSELATAVTGLVEDVSELATAVSSIQDDYVTEEELSSAISAVSAMVPAAQIQSDWDEEDPSSKAYILNKPDMDDYVTEEELASAISSVSAVASVHTDNTLRGDGTEDNPLGIEFPIVAGNNIATGTWNQFGTSFTDSNNGTWAGYNAGGITLRDPSGTVNIDVQTVSGWNSLQGQIDAVSAMVPEAQVQSDWDEDDPSSKAYILNKPEEMDLVAGDGIEITVSGTSVIISSDNPAVSGYVTEQELASVSGVLQLEIDTVSANPRIKVITYGTDTWSDVVSAMDGVHSGRYDYVVAKYSANDTELYAPLVRYVPGSSAYFVCPFQGTDSTYGYGERRTTEVFIINSGGTWSDRTVRPFQGRLIGRGNVSVTVQGEDYIVSGAGGTFEQVNADWNATSGVAEILNKPVIPAAQVNSDWNATSGVAEILNKPETVEIETVGVSAGSGIAITEVASGIVISCTVTGGPGGSYTAGDYIDITDDTISVTGITDLVAGNAITITSSGSSAIISSTGEAQVQSDWDVTDTSSKAYIRNKPQIPDAQVQSDWAEGSPYNVAYIRNKPEIHSYTGASGISISNDVVSLDEPLGLVAGNNVEITVSGVSAIISCTGSGGGSSYTAGTGIDITGTTISVSGVMMENPYFGIDDQGYATRYSPGTVTETIGQLAGVPLNMAVLDDVTYTMPCSGYTGEIKLYQGSDQWQYGETPSKYPSNDQLVFTKSDFAVISSGNYWVYFTNPGPIYGNYVTVTYSTSASPTRYLLSTAGITDIQQVSALPASPVSSVLYLIPEA